MSAAISSLLPPTPAPVAVGEHCSKTMRFTAEAIADFARITGDANPLHSDQATAARSLHGRVIAAGQHTTSQLIGLAATYFSREHGALQGQPRQALGLNYNFSLKHPVFADDSVELSWRVASVEWTGRLQGWLVQADGKVSAGERVCVVARATLLIKPFPETA
jgi:acyl dehydratase